MIALLVLLAGCGAGQGDVGSPGDGRPGTTPDGGGDVGTGEGGSDSGAATGGETDGGGSTGGDTGTGGGDSGAVACDPAPGVPGEDVTLELSWEGRARTWNVHLPADYDCTPRPVIVGLHYYTGTAENFEHDTAMIHDWLDEVGVIGIFPQAMARSTGPDDDWITAFNDISSHNDDGPDGATCTWWSWDYGIFDDCGPEESERYCRWGTSCADDVGMVREILRLAQESWTVDPDRIHLTGYSQGAIATQTWAFHLQDIVASVAPLHGFAANGHTVAPTEGVSLMQVWGTWDVGINGWETASVDGLIYDGAAETAAEWAKAQGCSAQGDTPYTTVSDGRWGWTCTQHDGCGTGADVVTCQWDGTHTWGRDGDGDYMWDAVWQFFQDHPRVRD